MYSTLCLCLLLAFYLFYNTSNRMKFKDKEGWAIKLSEKPVRCRLTGMFILFVCWVLIANLQGLLAGSFAWGAYIMAIGSMVILLNPFRYLRWRQIIAVFLVCFFMELLVF